MPRPAALGGGEHPTLRRLLLVALLAAAVAALALAVGPSRSVETPAAGTAAASLPPLPPGWPETLELGLNAGLGGAAATAAMAPFQFRYQYLAGGVNTGAGWASWSDDGQFVIEYARESDANGMMPVFTYYMIRHSIPGSGQGEAEGVFNNLQDASTMSAYWSDLRLFFQRAAAYGDPVVLHVEPDLWGYLQQRTRDDDASSVPTQVAATGIPELAGLPDDASGFGQAIVRLRDAYAPNVLLGYHLSIWGTGDDIANSDPPEARIDALANRAADFYNSLAADFDVAFAEFSDRDAGFKQYVYDDGGASWWDADDFARHRIFLAAFSQATQKRIVMWQIPFGNTKMRAQDNTPNHYQDNRVEWLLDDPGRVHLLEYVDAGVIAFLFGRGAGGTTCPCDANEDGVTNPPPINGNDARSLNADDDGGFFRQKAAAYYAAGRLSLLGPPPYAVVWQADDTPEAIDAGGSATVSLSFSNAGALTWPAGRAAPVRLSYHWLRGACPGAEAAVWYGGRTALTSDVAPGAEVTDLVMTVAAPATAGNFCLELDLVREGVTWFSSVAAATLKRTVSIN